MLALKLALAYFKRRKVRTLLTLLSVAVAMASLVAIRGLNGSMDYVAGEMAGLLGGRAQLEIKGPVTGMKETLVPWVKEQEGIQTAVPFTQNISLLEEKKEYVLTLGIDPREDRKIRTYQLLSGRLPSTGEKEIVVSNELTRGTDIRLGDTLHLQGIQGMAGYKLVGILEDAGIARANGGMVVFLPLDQAQKAFSLEEKVSYISIVLKDYREQEQVKQSIGQKLEESLEVRAPSARRSDLDKLLGMIKGIFSMYGSIGLFLALFVVYNSISVAVAEQKSQIGILRALGWRRRDTGYLILLEALFLGGLSSLIGLFIGKYLAEGLLSTVAPALKEWAKINITQVHLSQADYLGTWLIGVAACLVSAWLPARQAARVSPMIAIRRDFPSQEKCYPRWRLLAGLILIGLSVFVLGYTKLDAKLVTQTGPLFFVAGITLMVPPLLVTLLQSLEAPARHFLGIPGQLGIGSFRRSPRRAVITGMPLLLGMGICLGFLTIGFSVRQSTIDWMEGLVAPDIVVNQGLQASGSTVANLTGSVAERVGRLAGVDVVAGLRATTVKWQGMTLDINAVDIVEWSQFARPPMIEPGAKEALKALEGRGNLWISESLHLKKALKTGDYLTLTTPTGKQKFKIAGILKDFSSQEGFLMLNRKDYLEFWEDPNLDYLDITVKPGAEPEEVRERIEAELKKDYRVHVELASAFRGKMLKISGSLIDILNMVVIVAILVGAIGIANSLLIAVLERTRETGILRSIGMLRRELRRMYLVEVGALLLVGFILAVPIGWSFFEMGLFLQKNVNGWVYDRFIPWTQLGIVTVIIWASAWFSALYPAWLGARVDPVEALRSE